MVPDVSGSNLLIVCVLHVLREHTLGVKERAIQGDDGAHYSEIRLRTAIIHGQDDPFQFSVQGRDLTRRVRGSFACADRPACDAFNTPFDPPPIEHAQAGHSVHGGLHAAGSGGFKRTLWRVEPKVHTGRDQLGPTDVVVLEVDDGHIPRQASGRFENVSDGILAATILGVSLSSIDSLYRSGVPANGAQTFNVGKQQIQALIGGGSSAEAYGQSVLVEAVAGAALDGRDQRLLRLAMRLADFVERNADDVA